MKGRLPFSRNLIPTDFGSLLDWHEGDDTPAAGSGAAVPWVYRAGSQGVNMVTTGTSSRQTSFFPKASKAAQGSIYKESTRVWTLSGGVTYFLVSKIPPSNLSFALSTTVRAQVHFPFYNNASSGYGTAAKDTFGNTWLSDAVRNSKANKCFSGAVSFTFSGTLIKGTMKFQDDDTLYEVNTSNQMNTSIIGLECVSSSLGGASALPVGRFGLYGVPYDFDALRKMVINNARAFGF